MSKDTAFLESMKTQIEQMNKLQHIEVLKILLNNPKVKLNENKSGVYVNLSFLPDDIISSLSEYVDYIQKQETSLTTIESQKQTFRQRFFDE
jgi:hypothetical protein